MSRGRWALVLAVGLLAAAFSFLNRGETAILHLGFTTLYRVPVSILVFVAFLLGMLTMFLAGLRHDLRVRRALRERERPGVERYPELDPTTEFSER